MKKLIFLLIPVLFLTGCNISLPESSSFKQETQTSEANQKAMIKTVPIPTVTQSLERKNVSARAKLFDDANKISYIYLTSFGKVMAFYTVKGKVSSLRSYLSPSSKVVKGNGEPCDSWSSDISCFVIETADIDGTYGENVAGIFFFTTEGAYVEWNGEYIVSDQPLKITTPVELTREIK